MALFRIRHAGRKGRSRHLASAHPPAGLGGVENLGEPINTPGDEMFPTFRPNGDFYFSSNGHVGMGGLDIYIAKVNSITRKYELTHPGYPLNTEADDFWNDFRGSLTTRVSSAQQKDGRGLRSYLPSRIRRLLPQ